MSLLLVLAHSNSLYSWWEHHHPSWKMDDLNLYCERRLAKVPHPSCKTDDLLVGLAWKLRLACKLGSFCKSELHPQNKKKEPPKQQRTNSIFFSDFQGANEIHLAFVSSLFYHLVYKSWVGHLACKPGDLNLLWGWSTLHFVGWVVMLWAVNLSTWIFYEA